MAPAGTLDFRILGPFEVLSDGRPVPLGPGKERVLLAVLLLYRNERVSVDRLVDLLWDESPPESAPKMVQIYVSRLRRRLGRNERLTTQAAGYRLRVDRDELDLDRFERLAGEAREAASAGDAGSAAARLRDALLVWRGRALAEVAGGHFLEQERARLEELRLAALEERVEADLALGAGPALLDELQALVREHPLRERPSAQLMLALYRSGRQAEALSAYKELRDRLVGELGIEPGRPLKELEQAILRQDPALDAPVREQERHAAEKPPQRIARRRVAIPAAAGIAIAASVAVAIALSGRGEGRALLAADAVGIFRDGRIVDQARLGTAPAAVAAGDGGVWVASSSGNGVSDLDDSTLDIRRTIPVGDSPSGIAVGRGAVWVTNGLDGTVSRIDPKAGRVVQTIQVGNGPAAIAYGLGSVWVANRADQTVSQIDPRTGNVLDTLAAGTDAAAIAAGEGAVWVVDQARGRIARLQPGFTEPVVTINVGNGPSAIALGARSVWVANTLDSTVSRLDPRSDRIVATIPVGAGPAGLAAAPDGIWVTSAFDRTFWRIDPATDRVDRRVRLGQGPVAVAGNGSGVVVATGPLPGSHRGGTLRVASGELPSSIDPLDGWWPAPMTNDGLTAFRRVGGVEGTQLVPDLAASLPTPTDGGTTYTFRLRRGIRYSDGRLVRPEDVRRAVRRALIVLHDPYYFGAIVGAGECAADPRRCDLARGIAIDRRASTVTFHLKAPDPEFLFKLALPAAFAVPEGTPDRHVGIRPVPATGPYEIAAYKPGRLIRFARNPRFHLWSAAAQPAGYPDRIIWHLGVSPAAQVAAVESEQADVAFDGVPTRRLAEVTTQYASRTRQNLLAGTTFMFLNTRVPPFDDVRVRRAISYAVDRGAVVRALGGPEHAQPTCQILPPNFAGYRPYCPYTLRPSAAGTWAAPDLSKAQRLIAGSGTRGAKVTVWIPPNHRPEGAVVVALLRQLGYRARGKLLGSDYYAKIGNSRLKVQAGVHTWLPDYPAAAGFLHALFSCEAFQPGTGANLNASEFCDRHVDRLIERARALEVTDPALASSLWSKIDHELVNEAPVVPLVNPTQVDFLSRRVGNYQFNPQWHMLLDQLWVR